MELVGPDRGALKAGPFGSSLKKDSYVKQGYKVYGQEQVIRNDPYFGDYYIDGEKFRSLQGCAVKPRDLLISLVGTIGRTLILPGDCEPGIINPRLIKVSLNEAIVVPEFVQLFLQSQYIQHIFKRVSHGGTMEILNMATLKALALPVPPVREQLRIVAKIEELFSDLDAGVAALERARANLKRYRAAVLKAAVEGKLTEDWRARHPDTEPASVVLERILTERRHQWEKEQLAKFADDAEQPAKAWQRKYKEPGEVNVSDLPVLPRTWCWVSVDQVADDVTVGHVGPMRKRYVSEGIAFLRSQNVRPLRYEAEGLQFIPAEFHKELAKSCLRGGELLVVRSGVNVGDSCVYPVGSPEANCADLVITRAAQGFHPSFGAIFVNSPTGKAALYLKRTGNAQPHFNIGAMRVKPFPFPPKAEQCEIVARVEQAFSIVDQIEKQVDHNLQRATRLRQGILKQAFEGRLVPQDPSEEPSEKLLQRPGRHADTVRSKYNRDLRTRRTRHSRNTISPSLPFPEDAQDGKAGDS
jgi:type I restriction enzyme S subunit